MNYAFHEQYMTDRAVTFAKVSMLVNAAVAFGKIGLGIYSLSPFICVNGLYNIGIAAAKKTAVKSHHQQDQRGHYQWVGIIILAASIVYMICCANMAVRGNTNMAYDTVTGIAIATFTFTEVGGAVYGLIAARKKNDLTLAAAKRINLVTALISLVLTQSALLGMGHTANAARYCGWTGLIFGGVSAAVGLLMLVEARRIKIRPLISEPDAGHPPLLRR